MIKYFCYELQNHITLTGCGSAWLERLIWDQEVAGSNPVTPIPITLGKAVVLWWV